MQKVNAWRLRFIARVLALSVAVQVPAVFVLAELTQISLAWVALALLACLGITLRRLVFWDDDAHAPWWRTWLLEAPYAAYGTGCFVAMPLILVAMLSLGAYRLITGETGPEILTVLTFVEIFAWSLGVYGSTVGRVLPRSVILEVPVEGLARVFDGYRIAQVSDIHCGPNVPRWMLRYWARRAMALKPDVMAVTGDLIAAGGGYLSDVTYFCKELSAPDGVVACLGNHDYFATKGVPAAVQASGARLLRNQGFVVTRESAGIYLCGIDDRWSHRDNVSAALCDRPDAMASVMLAHDPQQFPEIARAGVSLVLSGHTHGGQFAVPFLSRWLNVARFGMPFTRGRYTLGPSTLFVNAGLGTSGPATRIGVHPEVALIVLRAK